MMRASDTNSEKDMCDFCLISLWSQPVSINPLYHFVRKSLNEITSNIVKRKLEAFNPWIKISNEDQSLLRYQVKYPCAPALLALAAVLEDKYKVKVVALDIEREKNDSKNWLQETVREITEKTRYGVLISFVSTEVTKLFEFSSILKKIRNNLKIVVGGVHATYNDAELLKSSDIDIVVRGEGEKTIVELCQAIVDGSDVRNIKGISFLDNGVLFRSSERDFINLEELPIPAYHYVKDYIDKIVVTTMFSRGCPYGCDYCAESAFWTRNVRYKNVSSFVDEIELLVTKYNQHFIHIADSTFGVNRYKLEQLCDELEKRKIDCFFSINIRPNVFEYMGEEAIRRLKRLNFVEMYIGVESANSVVLNSLNRKGNNTLVETLEGLKRIGIPFVKLYFMIGSPQDSRKAFEETVLLIEDLLEKELIFYATCKYFVPSVGSTLYNHVEGGKLLHKDSIRLDRYNSPPIYIPSNTISQEMDLYLQLIQVIQYKHYLKHCDNATREMVQIEWEKFVADHYCHGYYF